MIRVEAMIVVISMSSLEEGDMTFENEPNRTMGFAVALTIHSNLYAKANIRFVSFLSELFDLIITVCVSRRP